MTAFAHENTETRRHGGILATKNTMITRSDLRDLRDLRGKALVVLLIALMVLSTACSNHDPIRATTIQLGKSLNPDRTVGSHTTRFKPGDTIYAAVLTTGSGSATISARWTYAGRVVGEPRKEVRYKGDAATEFHLQNSSGFPPGDYRVELFVDDTSAGSRGFRIEK